MNIISWVKSLFKSKQPVNDDDITAKWNDLLPGDHVILTLHDPRKVGIINSSEFLTYQRMDAEDILTLTLCGYVIRKDVRGVGAAKIELLEFNALKNKAGKMTFVQYLLLKEEIRKIRVIEDYK